MKVGTDAMVLGATIQPIGKRALDVGAGTGVLSLMVAQTNPQILIDAVEVDGPSAAECNQNFLDSLWSNRLHVHHADFQHFVSDRLYDCIFSNPPFYTTRLLNEDPRKSISRHEQSLPIAVFFLQVNRLLQPNGEVWMIVPFSDREKWTSQAQKRANLFVRSEIGIIGKRGDLPKRSVLHFTRLSAETNQSTLTVREQDGTYTDEYKHLTREFHSVTL